MQRNLAQSPNRNVVEGALPLQAGVDALHGYPLLVEGLPLAGSEACFDGEHRPVLRVRVNDGRDSILLTQKAIGNDERTPPINYR